MNYAKSYIDNFRKYSAAVAAEKAARAALENEYKQTPVELAASTAAYFQRARWAL